MTGTGWQKHGLVFSPSGEGGWMKTHAQVPTPLLCDGYIRVYFSSRPERTLSLTSFVDLALDDPIKILRVNPDPILKPGPPGTFDEHGIMPSCAVRHDSLVYLYYSGWSRSTSVPYTNSTGLAISEDGGETFRKLSEGPILGKSVCDPYSATSPCVVKQGDEWHMWYCSGMGWHAIGGKYEHTYDVKYASSADGIRWEPSGAVAIGQQSEFEAITRPWVTIDDAGHQMWFCYRGSHSFRDGDEAYRIGHASSPDLRSWTRDDPAALEPSLEGWDSRMVAYPAVVTVAGRAPCFFNGNDFGADGFGLATRPMFLGKRK